MPSWSSPSQFSNKTFASALTQTESTECMDASTSVKIDSSECIVKTDYATDYLQICQNEQHIESSLFSKPCESHIKAPKPPPNPKPPDPKNGGTPIFKKGTISPVTLSGGQFLQAQSQGHN